jgi:predicted amidohydrolase
VSRTLNIAAAQYQLDELQSQAQYEDKISRWVEDAVAVQMQSCWCFRSMARWNWQHLPDRTLRLTCKVPSTRYPSAWNFRPGFTQGWLPGHGVTIVGASGPVRHADGSATNVARMFHPSGKVGEYAKLMMTPWERDPVEGICRTGFGPAGVRHRHREGGAGDLLRHRVSAAEPALAEAGAEIILAPSNTETEHGYWRVRTGCMARALENQVYTVHSPTVGPAPWCPPVEMNVGSAGIYAASDTGFPAGGVMALGELNKPQWVHAQVDLDLLPRCASQGAFKRSITGQNNRAPGHCRLRR